MKAYHAVYLRTTRGGAWYIELDAPIEEYGVFHKKTNTLTLFNQKPFQQVKEFLILMVIVSLLPIYVIYQQTNLYINKVPICTMDANSITDHREKDDPTVYYWEKIESPVKNTNTSTSFWSDGTTSRQVKVTVGIQYQGGKELLFSPKEIFFIFFYSEVSDRIQQSTSPLAWLLVHTVVRTLDKRKAA